jgi:hypothetical protein
MRHLFSFHSSLVVSLSLVCTLMLSRVTNVDSFSPTRTAATTFASSTKIEQLSLKGQISSNNESQNMNRQTAMQRIALAIQMPLIWSQGMPVQVANAKISIRPDAAFKSLEKAREELQTIATTYLPNKDYDGLRDYLSDATLNMNRYEENANALLASKELDAESKKEIGTIRRYGVGADVIIMYGGLKAELEEEDISVSNLTKSLKRTMDSLDEVIAICRSNGF